MIMRCIYFTCETWELEYRLQYHPKLHSLFYNSFQLVEFEFKFKLNIYTNLSKKKKKN